MFKKSITVLLFSLIFALILGTTGAFADSAEQEISPETVKALADVEKVNDKIYEEIEKAQKKSYELYDKKLEDLGKETKEEKIAEIEAKYEEKVVKLISDLDKKTQQMTRKGAEKANKAGVEVVIEWIPVQFADRVALIDPLRAVGW